MIERLKIYINRLIADSVKHPEFALNNRGQAFGALMFVLEDTTLTEDGKTDLCNFWDKAWANFATIYDDYEKGDI